MNMRSYKCCDSDSTEFGIIDSLAGLLKIVGDEDRLRLLCLLQQSELTPGSLLMSQSGSRNLDKMLALYRKMKSKKVVRHMLYLTE